MVQDGLPVQEGMLATDRLEDTSFESMSRLVTLVCREDQNVRNQDFRNKIKQRRESN